MITTGTINAHSLSGFPRKTKFFGARKSQQKYPTMARILAVRISAPKVLSLTCSTFELEAQSVFHLKLSRHSRMQKREGSFIVSFS